MIADLTNPIFTDEEAARKHFEAIRWPNGPYCPKCGGFDRVSQLGGQSMGPGWYHCNDCRMKFTATMGSIYERSHIPLHKWFLATHLMMASKKGMSALQIQRMLGLGSYRTAWFMMMRIREGIRVPITETSPLGGEGKTVEIDETFVGGKEKNKHRSKRQHVGTGGAGKEAVFSLVERKGRVRSHHVPAVNAATLRPVIRAHVDGKTYVMSDEGPGASKVGSEFERHDTVNHGIGEYVRGGVHTNTIESYFAILKRGIYGTFHSVSQQHLKRYLCEFDFRYNERAALDVTDAERTTRAIMGVVGKRLTYRQPDRREAEASA